MTKYNKVFPINRSSLDLVLSHYGLKKEPKRCSKTKKKSRNRMMKRNKRSLWKEAEERYIFTYQSFEVRTKKNKSYIFWKGKLLLPPYIKNPLCFFHHYRVAWYDAIAAAHVGSAEMRLYGSTCFACQTHRYSRLDGSCGTIPRIYKTPKQLSNSHFISQIAKVAEFVVMCYYKIHDKSLLSRLQKCKDIVPDKLRIANTIFTAVALIGSPVEKKKHNHPHKDINDIVSIFITFGDRVTGGSTNYYDGDKPSAAKVTNVVQFEHGQFQIGPFNDVLHEGQKWTGNRMVISFFLSRTVLKHFEENGKTIYHSVLLI